MIPGSLRILKKISYLEQHYCQNLVGLSRGPEAAAQTHVALARSYSRLALFIRDLRGQVKNSSPSPIDAILDAYLQRAQTLHERNLYWLSLYQELVRPAGKPAAERFCLFHRVRQGQTFQDLWGQLFEKGGEAAEALRMQALIDLKIQRDNVSLHSIEWGTAHHKFVGMVFDLLMKCFNENHEILNSLFLKTLYRYAGHHLKTGPLSAGPDAGPAQHEGDRLIDDWIAGFRQPQTFENSLEPYVSQRWAPLLAQRYRKRIRRLFVRYSSLVLLTVLFVGLVHKSGWDRAVYDSILEQVRSLRLVNLNALQRRMKSDYFYKYILDIGQKFDAATLTRHVETFLAQKIYEKPEGYQYFAENILQSYFPLLAEGRISSDLKAQVLDAAGLLDREIQKNVKVISELYERPVIYESVLRESVLKLRRLFVSHNLFSFMFLALYKGTPYIMVFPETIREEIFFPKKNLEKLGIDPALYAGVDFPLRAYVVSGDTYPFKDRAGYFEGEYAVVFADLAYRPRWTAWHEFGHVFDRLRYYNEKQKLPGNVEVHAMLFPLIFTNRKEAYFRERLIPAVKQADPADNYVQAAKGILNGFGLYLNQTGRAQLPVITDRFSPADIAAYEKVVPSLTREDIGKIAATLYQEPQVYLKTARAGTYRGVLSNAEEVILGTPGPPQLGFILTQGGSWWEKGSGSRLFFDMGLGNDSIFPEKNLNFFLKIINLFLYPQYVFSAGTSRERLLAALTIFIFVETFILFLQFLGTPLRRWQYQGRSIEKMIRKVYQDHPVSRGQSREGQPGERELLGQVYRSFSNISGSLRTQIQVFKALATRDQRMLFDVLITLAPFNPKKSGIDAKWHNLLFWLPFLGPPIARSSWIFPRQRFFKERERFNRRVMALAKRIRPDSSPHEVEVAWRDIFQGYLVERGTNFAEVPFLQYLSEGKNYLDAYWNDYHRIDPRQRPRLAHSLVCSPKRNGDFDRLDRYTPGEEIKDIDWKATARSPQNEPKVKKYSGALGTQVDLIFDFRNLAQPAGCQKIAEDLTRSLQMLESYQVAYYLTFLMPRGEIVSCRSPIQPQTGMVLTARAIWARVSQEFERYQARLNDLQVQGLIFYTDEENRAYRQRLQLTDWLAPQLFWQSPDAILARSENLFLIGFKSSALDDVLKWLPQNHQYFYWP